MLRIHPTQENYPKSFNKSIKEQSAWILQFNNLFRCFLVLLILRPSENGWLDPHLLRTKGWMKRRTSSRTSMEARQFETTTDRPSEWLIGVKCRVTSVAKKGENVRLVVKYVFAGNGEERRSGEPPLGRSAGLLNNKQQFFILLGRNNTAIYPTSFNREKKKKPTADIMQSLTCLTLSPVMCIWRGSSYQKWYLHFRFDLSGKILRCFHMEHFRWPFWMW